MTESGITGEITVHRPVDILGLVFNTHTDRKILCHDGKSLGNQTFIGISCAVTGR